MPSPLSPAADRMDVIGTAALLRALGAVPYRERPVQSSIAACLRLRPGPTRTSELIDYVWGGVPDGGPEWAWSVLAVTIHKMRVAGWDIKGMCPGYSLAGGDNA